MEWINEYVQAVVKLNAPPNTPVFTLQAKDPDSDPNLHYFLVRDRSKQFEAFSCQSFTGILFEIKYQNVNEIFTIIIQILLKAFIRKWK